MSWRRPSEISFLLLLFHRSGLIVIDGAALPLRSRGEQHLLNDFRQGHGGALDRAGQGIAAEGAKCYRALARPLARTQRKSVVVDHEQQAVSFHRGTPRREIQRHDRYVLEMDIDRKSTRLNSSHLVISY